MQHLQMFPILPSYFDCRPEMIIHNYDLYTFMICK